MNDAPPTPSAALADELDALRAMIDSAGYAEEAGLQYAEEMWHRHGCPRRNGYPCQGIGDFGAHDVRSHCPAVCWVGVARGDGDGR